MGKSRICAEIAKQRSLKWHDVSQIAKDKGFVDDYDENLECPILDEDKVMFEIDSNENVNQRNHNKLFHLTLFS